MPWWTEHERTVEEWSKISAADARDVRPRGQAPASTSRRYLQGFFLEEPPDVNAKGWAKLKEGRRILKRFRKIKGDEVTGPRVVPHGLAGRVPRPQLRVRIHQADVPGQQRVRDALAAVPAGHVDRPAVPPALGRRRRRPGVLRARDGRHGLHHRRRWRRRARENGAEIRTESPVAKILVDERARRPAWSLEDGTEIHARDGALQRRSRSARSWA